MPWPKGRPRSPETLQKIAASRTPIVDSYWAKVPAVSPDDCWPWLGHIRHDGYGCLSTGRQSTMIAHRFAWLLLTGEPPAPYLDLDHQCHNRDISCAGGSSCLHRRCVNPLHLRATDRRTNLLSGRGFAAEYSARSTCKHGHELTEANSYHRAGPDGSRMKARECRRCRADVEARRRAKGI